MTSREEPSNLNEVVADFRLLLNDYLRFFSKKILARPANQIYNFGSGSNPIANNPKSRNFICQKPAPHLKNLPNAPRPCSFKPSAVTPAFASHTPRDLSAPALSVEPIARTAPELSRAAHFKGAGPRHRPLFQLPPACLRFPMATRTPDPRPRSSLQSSPTAPAPTSSPMARTVSSAGTPGRLRGLLRQRDFHSPHDSPKPTAHRTIPASTHLRHWRRSWVSPIRNHCQLCHLFIASAT